MPASKAPCVWIVDDDADDQFLFKTAFRQLIPPVEVNLLSDGEQLLPALAQSPLLPSLILLDLNMPLLNGFETLEQLRADPTYQHVPVVVLTTSSSYQDKEKAILVGANGFLTKPPSMNAILALFDKLVQEWKLA